MMGAQRINAFAVALPAQTFEVRSFVTLERTVPVMTEFAVRIVWIVGGMSFSSLQRFLGLSAFQAKELFGSLQTEGLIEVVDERIELSSYALARFEASSDGSPQFTRIAERVSYPTFELLTFGPVRRDISTVHSSFAVDLELPYDLEKGDTTARAERAYIDNFHDIERITANQLDRRAFGVYKVDEISAQRRVSVPVLMSVTVDENCEVDYSLDEEVNVSPQLKPRMLQLVADTIGKAPIGRDGYLLFRRLFSTTAPLTSWFPERFDAKALLSLASESSGESNFDPAIRPLAAATYLPESVEELVAHLSEAYEKFRSTYKNVRLRPNLLWFAPRSDFWGRTLLLGDACLQFKSAIRRLLDNDRSTVSVVFGPDPYADRDSLQRDLALASSAGVDDAMFVESGLPSSRFEMILLPGVFAAAVCHVNVPGTAGVLAPAGFSTYDVEIVRKVQGLMSASADTIRATYHRATLSGPLEETKLDGDFVEYLRTLPQETPRKGPQKPEVQ